MPKVHSYFSIFKFCCWFMLLTTTKEDTAVVTDFNLIHSIVSKFFISALFHLYCCSLFFSKISSIFIWKNCLQTKWKINTNLLANASNFFFFFFDVFASLEKD